MMELIKDFWGLALAVFVFILSSVLFHYGIIDFRNELSAIIGSFAIFFVAENIREHIFRSRVLNNFSLLSEAKVLDNTSTFFKDLYGAIERTETKNIDVCYFTQQAPTTFYHLRHVKHYWEELPKLLNADQNKTLRRVVMVGNKEMFDWTIKHMEDSENNPNYSLAVIIDENSDNAYINLCLTSDGQCFLFSPHAMDQQPSYIWIKNENIYRSLLLSYDRMWNKSLVILRGGTINKGNVKILYSHFTNHN